MSLLSWRTEVWVNRCSLLVVSSENQRSTRLSQLELVGGEVRDEPWMGCEPTPYRRGLVGGGVVQDQVHVQIGVDFGVDLLEEGQELLGSVAGVQ
jgi:hypothetical protein